MGPDAFQPHARTRNRPGPSGLQAVTGPPPPKSAASIRSLLCVGLHAALALQLVCHRGRPAQAEEEERPAGLQASPTACSDCRLTAGSLDELARRPRQMDGPRQLVHPEERLELDKIKRLVCKELTGDSERERCRNFYFTQQASVRKWREAAALAPRGKLVSFHDFVCIRELKLCCPSQSFGPKCSRCPKCAANEQCEGEATRQGRGTCQCRPGHAGANCDSCQRGFYLDERPLALAGSSTSGRAISCKACHRSCEYCRGPGPRGCEVCRAGFSWQPSYGCLDVDECIQSGRKICGPNTFCVNTEGSHFCYECDRACAGCRGDGPDMCLACAPGYQLDSAGNCAATRKTILPPEANYYRYAIYAGLCLCTCIILNNSVYMASLVGLGVALYIGASEYVMSGQPGAAPDERLAAGGPPRLGL